MNKIRKNWCMHTALVAHAAANCQKTAPVVTQKNNPKTRRAYALTASSVFILKYSSASFGLFASCALTSSVLCVARIAVTVYCLCQYWNVHLRKSVNKIRIRRDINPIKMFSIHSKTIWNVYLPLPAPTHTHLSCAMLNTGNGKQFHCACVRSHRQSVVAFDSFTLCLAFVHSPKGTSILPRINSSAECVR